MTAPKSSCMARNPKTICTAYCIASPIMATTIIHRERSYRLFSHLTCRWASATNKALTSMNMKHANWSRNNESIRLQKYENNFRKRYNIFKMFTKHTNKSNSKTCSSCLHANIVQRVKSCYKIKINYRESKSCFYGFLQHKSHPCQPSKTQNDLKAPILQSKSVTITRQ